jgi:hypothetical protein
VTERSAKRVRTGQEKIKGTKKIKKNKEKMNNKDKKEKERIKQVVLWLK